MDINQVLGINTDKYVLAAVNKHCEIYTDWAINCLYGRGW